MKGESAPEKIHKELSKMQNEGDGGLLQSKQVRRSGVRKRLGTGVDQSYGANQKWFCGKKMLKLEDNYYVMLPNLFKDGELKN